MSQQRALGRVIRHRRIRKRVNGFAERPRLNVFRSHKHLYAQIINDFEGVTMIGCSTKQLAEGTKAASGGTVAAATQLGRHVAQEALKKGISAVVFDRGGYRFHGRVQAFAQAAREGGLKF